MIIFSVSGTLGRQHIVYHCNRMSDSNAARASIAGAAQYSFLRHRLVYTDEREFICICDAMSRRTIGGASEALCM